MKNSISFLSVTVILISVFFILPACKSKKTQTYTLPKKPTLVLNIKLKMPKGVGTNGAAVAFDYKKGYYYAVFAGNRAYPFSVFNATGQPVDTFSKAGYDARGLWYNPRSGQIEGNEYSGGDLLTITRNSRGIPNGTDWMFFDFTQPGGNCSACFDTAKNEFVFYYNGYLHFLDRGNGEEMRTKPIDNIIMTGNINSTTCISTGILGAEFGLLDFVTKRILLINGEGKLVKALPLPPNATVNELLNFSFSNGHFWLFDIKSRTWMGYKLK